VVIASLGSIVGRGSSGTVSHPTSRSSASRSSRANTIVLTEAFACAVVMTVLGIAPSYFLQHAVDFVLIRRDAGLLDAFGIGTLVIVVFGTLLGTLRRYLAARRGTPPRTPLAEPLAHDEATELAPLGPGSRDRAESGRPAAKRPRSAARVDAQAPRWSEFSGMARPQRRFW
jgi:hypothetical protein